MDKSNPHPQIEHSLPVNGHPIELGTGFTALSFKHSQFRGLMDPLVMVDHFTMTEPTFGAHPHAGMSAVSMLFEDSEGRFHNRDSLGNDFDLFPGDLYWLKAGRGAVHDEAPLPGGRTHALQIFVNLPATMKSDAPDSLRVRAKDIPLVRGVGHRVRVVLGQSNSHVGAIAPALPLTILDGALEPSGSYSHMLPPLHSAWLHAVRGNVQIHFAGSIFRVGHGEAIALRSGEQHLELRMRSQERAQFVLLQGAPLKEPFVQQGPFVMSNRQQLKAVAAEYAAGRLGSLD